MIPRVCAVAVVASVVGTSPCMAMEEDSCLAGDSPGSTSVLAPIGPCAGSDFGFVDGFLGEATRIDLISKLPGKVTSALKARLPLERTRFELDVPRQLARQFREAITCEAVQSTMSWRLPASAIDGANVSTHMDVTANQLKADSIVGLLYLHGSGKIEFTEVDEEKLSIADTIPTKHSVDIFPGRMVVWNNKRLLHRVVGEKGQARIFIGPATVDSGAVLPVGVPTCEWWANFNNECKEPGKTCVKEAYILGLIRETNRNFCCVPCTCADWLNDSNVCPEGMCPDTAGGKLPVVNATTCCDACPTCKAWKDSGANCSEQGMCFDDTAGDAPSQGAENTCCKACPGKTCTDWLNDSNVCPEGMCPDTAGGELPVVNATICCEACPTCKAWKDSGASCSEQGMCFDDTAGDAPSLGADNTCCKACSEKTCADWLNDSNVCPEGMCPDTAGGALPVVNATICCEACPTCKAWQDSGAKCSEQGTWLDDTAGDAPSQGADKNFCCKACPTGKTSDPGATAASDCRAAPAAASTTGSGSVGSGSAGTTGSGSAGSGSADSGGSGSAGGGAPSPLKMIPGTLFGQVFEIGEGNDARSVQPFPGALLYAQGKYPASIVPKGPPPQPTAESASYLACSVHEGQLMVAEIIIFVKDGKVYAKQGSAKVKGGYRHENFEGDLSADAKRQYSSMSPSDDLTVTDMLYTTGAVGGHVIALQGENVHVEIKVPDPKAFCKDNNPVLKTLANKIAEKTGVKTARAGFIKCTPKGLGLLEGRRLDTTVERNANADVDVLVFLPADQASQGIRALTDSLLSDVSDVVSSGTTNAPEILAVQTPQGFLLQVSSRGSASGGSGGGAAPLPGTGSMPGALGAAVQQGFRAAIHTHDLLGKYIRDWNLASRGSGVYLLATVLGFVVLIAAAVKQRWAGEHASDLLQEGDALLADDE